MTRIRWAGLFLLIVGISSSLWAADADRRFTVGFSSDELKIETRYLAEGVGQPAEPFQVLSLGDLDFVRRPGEPSLPARTIQIYVPRGKQIKQVVVESLVSSVLPGQYLVLPGQREVPMSSGLAGESAFTPEPIPPDPAIYSSDAPYPSSPVALAATGAIGGRQIATVQVFPLQYAPASRQITFNKEMVLGVEFADADAAEAPEIPRETAEVARFRNSVVARMVENADDVEADFAPVGTLSGPDAVEYLIICHENHVDEYAPLLEWKTRKGVPAAIKTWPEIISTYSGRDYPEKLRNCIKDYYLNHSTLWVVVSASGAKGMPYLRGCYCDVWGTTDNAIPCDLYFSDMTGDWNLDNDGLWGETSDGTDLYPDVYVGRFTANTGVQASTIVNKVLTYEGALALPTDYQQRMLFMAEWLDESTDGAINKNKIDNESVPALFDPIQKLYESSGNENRAACIAALNSGKGIVNHDGHGNVTIISVGPDVLSDNDMAALTNAPRYTVFYTLACDPAAYDGVMGCLGKSFTEATAGGGFFVGNSRYGWYSPGSSGNGTGDLFDRQFFKSIFIRGFVNLGAIHADAKVQRIPYSLEDDTYRWTQFSLNLLGDPETPVWLATPGTIAASYPAEIETGSQTMVVSVTAGGSALSGARVCLWKGNDVYLVGQTLANGTVSFDVAPADTGTMLVTVTKNGYLPSLGSTHVIEALSGVAAGEGAGRLELAAAPNPGLGSIAISFAVPRNASVAGTKPEVAVYDASGRLVADLAVTADSRGRVTWDGRSASGARVPPGIYFLKLSCGQAATTAKVVLLN